MGVGGGGVEEWKGKSKKVLIEKGKLLDTDSLDKCEVYVGSSHTKSTENDQPVSFGVAVLECSSLQGHSPSLKRD